MCLVGNGDGIGLLRLGFGRRTCPTEAWVARAGVVALDRLTVALAAFARTLIRSGLRAALRAAGFAIFFLRLRTTVRALLALTIQSDISKRPLFSVHIFSGRIDLRRCGTRDTVYNTLIYNDLEDLP